MARRPAERRLTDEQSAIAAAFYPEAVAMARELVPGWAWDRDRDLVISAVGLAVVKAAADWRPDRGHRFDLYARWKMPKMVANALQSDRSFRRWARVAVGLAIRRLANEPERDAAATDARIELEWRLARMPPKAAIVARAVLVDGLTSHAAARLARVRVELVRPIVSAAIKDLRKEQP